MPTYSEIEEDYLHFSEAASKNVKTSAISGVAGVWVVSHPVKDSASLLSAHHGLLAASALLFILALFFDLLHSFTGSILMNRRLNEVRTKLRGNPAARETEDFANPDWVNYPIWTLYQCKVLAIIAATIVLVVGVASVA